MWIFPVLLKELSFVTIDLNLFFYEKENSIYS